MEVKIEKSWQVALKDEFEKDYFKGLTRKVKEEYKSDIIYPCPKNIFKAFDLCPFSDVKVVILGQDPYHGPKQANGLCFAVSEGVKNPPSLQNIFKEVEKDLGITVNQSGDLTRWAVQGILLLNSVLTVKGGQPASHQGIGWETFTDNVIKILSDGKENLVFILWGNYARGKKSLIDTTKHFVIESPHPSPFSASSGFFGSKPFSKTNEFLAKKKIKTIDWSS